MFSNVGFFFGGKFYVSFEKKNKEFAKENSFAKIFLEKMAKFTTKIEIKIIDQGTKVTSKLSLFLYLLS